MTDAQRCEPPAGTASGTLHVLQGRIRTVTERWNASSGNWYGLLTAAGFAQCGFRYLGPLLTLPAEVAAKDAEIARLQAENAKLRQALERLMNSANSLARELSDPGAEALAAIFCAGLLLMNKVALPPKPDATEGADG